MFKKWNINDTPEITIPEMNENLDLIEQGFDDRYTKNEVNNIVEGIDVDLSNYYTKGQVDNELEVTNNKIIKGHQLQYNPIIDLVYDSCYDIEKKGESALGVELDSGQTFKNITIDGYSNYVRYDQNGVLEFGSDGINNKHSITIIDGFKIKFPYLKIKTAHSGLTTRSRHYYVKYIDDNNWLAVIKEQLGVNVTKCIDGVSTRVFNKTGSADELGTITGDNTIYQLEAQLVTTHTNFSSSGVAISLKFMGAYLATIPIDLVDWEKLSGLGTVGFSGTGNTKLFKLEAGVGSYD